MLSGFLIVAVAALVDGAGVDPGGDRISDALAARIESGHARRTADGKLALLVSLDEAPSPGLVTALANVPGVTVTKQWSDLVWAVAVELDAAPGGSAFALLAPLLANPRVRLVEEDALAKGTVFYSTKQTHARKVWQLGIDGAKAVGATNQSIAILDTGLDDTHPDLQVVAWTDFSGVDATVAGDEYATPTDKGAHGTHVGGIAAGRGSVAPVTSGVGNVPITFPGVIPQSSGTLEVNRFPIDTSGGAATLTGSLRWDCTVCGRDAVAQIIDPEPSTTVRASAQGPMTGPQPLAFAWNVPAATRSTLHRLGSGSVGGGNGGSTAYWAQLQVPLTAAGDGAPLTRGVAPGANLVGVKVLDDGGSGTGQQIIDGLTWVAANKETYGITVANLSLGIDGQMITAIDTAANNLVSSGVVVVVAAGNGRASAAPSNCIGSPGTASRVITVAAINETDAITRYSSIGCAATNPSKPDVAAPGGSDISRKFILSADSNDADDFSTTDRYPNDYVWSNWFGTSMSTPHVAGAAALLADSFTGWTYDEPTALRIKRLLLATATETNRSAEAAPNPTLNRGPKDVSEEAKAWARTVWLQEGETYSFHLDLGEAAVSPPDLDLFLYSDFGSSSPTAFGDPVYEAASTSVVAGGDEGIFNFSPVPAAFAPGATFHRYYLVAKAVSLTEDEPIMMSMTGPTAATAVDEAYALWEGRDVRVEGLAYPPATTWRILAGSAEEGPFERVVAHGAVAPAGGAVTAIDSAPSDTPWYVVEIDGPTGMGRSAPVSPGEAPAAEHAGGCAAAGGSPLGALLALGAVAALRCRRAT